MGLEFCRAVMCQRIRSGSLTPGCVCCPRNPEADRHIGVPGCQPGKWTKEATPTLTLFLTKSFFENAVKGPANQMLLTKFEPLAPHAAWEEPTLLAVLWCPHAPHGTCVSTGMRSHTKWVKGNFRIPISKSAFYDLELRIIHRPLILPLRTPGVPQLHNGIDTCALYEAVQCSMWKCTCHFEF